MSYKERMKIRKDKAKKEAERIRKWEDYKNKKQENRMSFGSVLHLMIAEGKEVYRESWGFSWGYTEFLSYNEKRKEFMITVYKFFQEPEKKPIQYSVPYHITSDDAKGPIDWYEKDWDKNLLE